MAQAMTKQEELSILDAEIELVISERAMYCRAPIGTLNEINDRLDALREIRVVLVRDIENNGRK